MSRPSLELASILQRYGEDYRRTHAMPLEQLKPMRAIETCRTAALGGHVESCGHCEHQRIAYNSCRNRHCPKCQTLAKEEWLARRKAELLPIPYYHVVFTLPPGIAELALQNKKAIYNILFAASAETLLTIAADPKHLGAKIGFFSILHTWGQNLLHHPHVHCVVTGGGIGGGIGPEGQIWIRCRDNFFLSVRVLSRLFRRLFLAALAKAELTFHGQLIHLNEAAAFEKHIAGARKQDWVVYAKAPFGGPEQVIDYLGRYTHKVAISNHRLLSEEDGQISFSYKNYSSADPQRERVMTLKADEFIRRSAACRSSGLPAHPALWTLCEPQPREQSRAQPQAARCHLSRSAAQRGPNPGSAEGDRGSCRHLSEMQGGKDVARDETAVHPLAGQATLTMPRSCKHLRCPHTPPQEHAGPGLDSMPKPQNEWVPSHSGWQTGPRGLCAPSGIHNPGKTRQRTRSTGSMGDKNESRREPIPIAPGFCQRLSSMHVHITPIFTPRPADVNFMIRMYFHLYFQQNQQRP